MTFADLIAAVIIFGLFVFGFAQVFLPAYRAWDAAMGEYRTAQAIRFIAESFKAECAKPGRNIENWKKAAAPVKELEHYEITELTRGDAVWGLKLSCAVSGERLEIIGVCAP